MNVSKFEPYFLAVSNISLLLRFSTILLEYTYELPAMSKIAISIGKAIKTNILVLIFIKILQNIVFLSVF